ncbi:hypothetical protein Tco_1210833 [Tanacetum coccineum]
MPSIDTQPWNVDYGLLKNRVMRVIGANIAPEDFYHCRSYFYCPPVVERCFLSLSPILGLCGLVPYTGSDSDSPDRCYAPPGFVDDHDSYPTRGGIPFGTTLPHTIPTVPKLVLTARKGFRVPLPARRLASRHASPRSPDHHSSSSSSSSDSSPVHSLGLDAPDQAHLGSPTRDVSPRFRYPPRRAPRRSEAYRRCVLLHYLLCIHRLHRDIIRSYGIISSTLADHLPPRRGIWRDRDVVGDQCSRPFDVHRLDEEEIVEPAGEDSPDLPITRDLH